MSKEKLANIVIIIFIVTSLFPILYGVIVYDKLLWFGWSGLLFFFGLPAIILIFLLLLLKLKGERKVNIVLFLTSTVFSAYIIEGFLTITTPSEQNVRIDARSYLDVVFQLRNNGKPATLNIVPASFLGSKKLLNGNERIMPLGGVADSIIVFCNVKGEWVIYESDEHGFRNPHGLYKTGEVQIIGIGDSFTHGMCVKTGKDMLSVIRRSYPETINLGMLANGPLIELASLREYGRPLKPKIVIWFYYEGNDLDDLNREKGDSLLMQYLNHDFSQNLFERRSEIQSLLIQDVEQRIQKMKASAHKARTRGFREYMWYLRGHPVFKFITFNHILSRLGLFPTYEGGDKPADLVLFRKILHTALEDVRSWGGKFYFIYLCGKNRFSRIGRPNPYREKVIEIVSSLNIPLIDTCEILNKQADPASLYEGGHYTEEGYALIADNILHALR